MKTKINESALKQMIKNAIMESMFEGGMNEEGEGSLMEEVMNAIKAYDFIDVVVMSEDQEVRAFLSQDTDEVSSSISRLTNRLVNHGYNDANEFVQTGEADNLSTDILTSFQEGKNFHFIFMDGEYAAAFRNGLRELFAEKKGANPRKLGDRVTWAGVNMRFSLQGKELNKEKDVSNRKDNRTRTIGNVSGEVILNALSGDQEKLANFVNDFCLFYEVDGDYPFDDFDYKKEMKGVARGNWRDATWNNNVGSDPVTLRKSGGMVGESKKGGKVMVKESQLRNMIKEAIKNNINTKNMLKENVNGTIEYINMQRYENEVREFLESVIDDYCSGEYERYHDLMYDMFLDENDYNYPHELAVSMNNSMNKYVHMTDHNMSGNFKNLEYDWEGKVGDHDCKGVSLSKVAEMLDNGVNNEITEEFKNFAVDWLWEAFGTFGIKYNFQEMLDNEIAEIEDEEY